MNKILIGIGLIALCGTIFSQETSAAWDNQYPIEGHPLVPKRWSGGYIENSNMLNEDKLDTDERMNFVDISENNSDFEQRVYNSPK